MTEYLVRVPESVSAALPGAALPGAVRPVSRGRVAAAWLLGLALFIGTLGAGYIAWSLSTWRYGQSPAQRMLRLRCWLPDARAVAGRKQMAVRQCTGFCLNGLFLAGVLVWLTSKEMRFMGDLFAGTVLLHDPDDALNPSSPAGSLSTRSNCLLTRTASVCAGVIPPQDDTRSRCVIGIYTVCAARFTGEEHRRERERADPSGSALLRK